MGTQRKDKSKDKKHKNKQIEAAPNDYYQILDIARDATEDQIKKAYRKQALKWHPDRNQGNEVEAAAQFSAVGEAFETLSDPYKRAQYDEFGPAVTNETSEEKKTNNNPLETFKNFFGRGWQSIFKSKSKKNKSQDKSKPNKKGQSSNTHKSTNPESNTPSDQPELRDYRNAHLSELLLAIADGNQSAYTVLRDVKKFRHFKNPSNSQYQKLKSAIDQNITSKNWLAFLCNMSKFQIQELQQKGLASAKALITHPVINTILTSKINRLEGLTLYVLALSTIDQNPLARDVVDRYLTINSHSTYAISTTFMQDALNNSIASESSCGMIIEAILYGEYSLHADALEQLDPNAYLKRLELVWPLLDYSSDAHRDLIHADLEKITDVSFSSSIDDHQHKFLTALSHIDSNANIYSVFQNMTNNLDHTLANITDINGFIDEGCGQWLNDQQSAQYTIKFLQSQTFTNTDSHFDREKLVIANVFTSTMNLYEIGADKDNHAVKKATRTVMEATYEFLKRSTGGRINHCTEYLDQCKAELEKLAPEMDKLNRAPILANIFVALVTLVIPYLIALVIHHNKTGQWGFFAKNHDKMVTAVTQHTEEMSTFLTAGA